MKSWILFLMLVFSNGLWAQQPRLVLPVGHSGHILDASFSPDGKLIATASTDRTAKLWSTVLKKELTTFSGHTDVITALSFSPDNKYLASASDDTTVKLWNIENGKLIASFKVHNDKLKSVAFSPNSKYIATSSEDSSISIWNVESKKMLHHIKGFKDPVESVNYSPDGKLIITTTLGGNVKIWNTANGKLFAEQNVSSGLSYGEFSPDGLFFLSLFSLYRDVFVKDLKGEWITTIRKAHASWISSAHFSPDGKTIITASLDRSIKFWDVASGKLKNTILAEESVENCSYSKDGRYIVASCRNKINVWNAASGELSYTLKGRTSDYQSASFSPDEKFIVAAGNSGPVNIWSVDEGRIVATISKKFSSIGSTIFSPDGKMILVCSYDEAPTLWDAFSGVLIKKFESLKSVATAVFSPDGKTILFVPSNSKTAKLFSASDGAEVLEIKGHGEDLWSATFSPDGKNIATASWDKTAKIWNATNGSFVRTLIGHDEMVASVNYSLDGKLIITAALDKTCRIWNAETGRLINTIKIDYRWASPKDAVFNADASLFSVRFMTRFFFIPKSDPASLVEVRNVKDGSLKYTLSEHTAAVNSCVFAKKNGLVLTSSQDNTCKLWDVNMGKVKNTFFVLDSNDYFNQIPAGYYHCSPNAAKLLHYVTSDLKVITFEQLDVKYNRPDLVLNAIGNTDANLIRSYKKAYDKRIKKLGIDTTQFSAGYSVPEMDFVNREAIEYEQKNNQLSIYIKGNDSTYKLDRFNIWINEIPLYGQKGISIRNRNKHSIDTTLVIELSAGENRIETSILNVNGTESYRMPLYVKYTPEKPTNPKVYFIGLGMDTFADSRNNLNYSSKDIRDMADSLKSRYGDTISIHTVFNKQVTAQKLIELKKILLKTNVNDKVIVSYSGHGLLSKDFDYYLSTYDVDFDHPENKGLPYEALENLLDSIPARQKLMLIDACHSGEVDKDELVRIKREADSLGLKGVDVVAYEGNVSGLGLQNSFELMQELFVNVGKGTGATVISASAGTQFALEKGDLKNGVFTYSILEAMRANPGMTVSQLKTIVGKRVVELTNGMQKPTSRNEIINSDWRLW